MAPQQIWPGGATAAVSITMDNMGEACDIELGKWPDEEPIGNHFSVIESLPRMLELLWQYNIRATYFIEAWNFDVYPTQIREIIDRGHEIGFHGFRHEPWDSLHHDQEQMLFERSVKNANKLQVSLKGIRPPGGKMTENTLQMLEKYGFTYVSPAAHDVAILGNQTIVLPFQWDAIDAYFYFEPLGAVRKARGDTEALLPPHEFEERTLSRLDTLAKTGGYCSLLFHPNLHNDSDRLAAMAHILEKVSQDKRIWCAPCHEISTWIKSHPEHFDATEIECDTFSWNS
ncbi:glycoside hydrolase/deacetylase [Penicillium sp. IBT 16267x]|nr:glycoside hydrolase/deacetylase [Penicillium sp. IBT 16267x]